MDERLQKALDFSNFMVSLNNQKLALRERFYQDVIYYFNGGQFTVSKELLTFNKMLIDTNQDETVLIDDNDTPVLIDDVNEFYNAIMNVYNNASNAYLVEYNKLKQNRKIEKLVDYE